MKLLFDLDSHTYRAAASCSPTKAKPYQEGMEEAIWRFESSFNQVLLDLNSNDYECYMKGEGNWRYDIYPDYKLNRRGATPPMWLEEVREHALLKYKAEICNGLEADDRCGIRLTQEGGNAICVSIDKDLLTVPGQHYNWVKKTRILVSPLDALRNFYKQVITGDGTDGVPAFDGKMRSATPQFVQKLLDPIDVMADEEEMWEYVLDIFCSEVDSFVGNGVGYSQALRNARVLWIQRKENDVWQEPQSLGQKLDGMPLS